MGLEAITFRVRSCTSGARVQYFLRSGGTAEAVPFQSRFFSKCDVDVPLKSECVELVARVGREVRGLVVARGLVALGA